MNNIVVSGRLATDPELAYTPQGTAVCKARIAVTNPFKKVEGKATADFFDFTAWRQTAEFVANHCAKGRAVIVRGRLEEQKWEQDGQKRSRIIINADEVEALGPKPGEPGEKAAAPQAPAPETDPFVSEDV